MRFETKNIEEPDTNCASPQLRIECSGEKNEIHYKVYNHLLVEPVCLQGLLGLPAASHLELEWAREHKIVLYSLVLSMTCFFELVLDLCIVSRLLFFLYATSVVISILDFPVTAST